MTQNEHVRLHPSASFSHALARDCVTTRGSVALTTQSAGLPTSMRSAFPSSTVASFIMSLEPRKWSTSGICLARSPE
jgi:hypothetical protein